MGLEQWAVIALFLDGIIFGLALGVYIEQHRESRAIAKEETVPERKASWLDDWTNIQA